MAFEEDEVMPQKHLKMCACRDCKVARRSGKVLGSRLVRPGSWNHGEPDTDGHYVSDYVAHPKFRKGRRPDNVEIDDGH